MVAPALDDIVPGSSPVIDTPGSPAQATGSVRASVRRDMTPLRTVVQPLPAGALYPPASGKGVDFMAGETAWNDNMGQGDMVLELADGLALSGNSFGADKSISGECVFQTGE